ncbi:MAG: hypothetical protein ABIH00_02825 [Armatimonadota bacterium]
MKKLLTALIVIAFLSTAAFAATTDTQTVYYEIDPIVNLQFHTDMTLTIDAATAGSQPNTDSTVSTYDLTTNETGKKITGYLNVNMPSSTYLSVNLSPPTGASSLGETTLTTTAQDLVTGIDTLAEPGNNYTVYLNAAVNAGLPADGSRVITFTVADE